MLIAERKGIFSNSYVIFDEGGNPILELAIKSISMTAHFMHDGKEFHFKTGGILSKEYFMMMGETVVGSAELASRFSADYNLNLDGRMLRLVRVGVFDQSFHLFFKQFRQGIISKKSAFSTAAEINLPDDWPMPYRLFIFWLVVVQWTQTEAAS